MSISLEIILMNQIAEKFCIDLIHLLIVLNLYLADVKMPSGNIDKPLVEDNHDGTVTITYDPREEGTHELCLKYNGENVQGKVSSKIFKLETKLQSPLIRFSVQVPC